jgi:hypothetical protein
MTVHYDYCIRQSSGHVTNHYRAELAIWRGVQNQVLRRLPMLINPGDLG